MAQPADTPPLFVPQTVARSESAATRIARRTLGPLRGLGARVMAFADRLIGGWTGGWTGGAGLGADANGANGAPGTVGDRIATASLRMSPAGLPVPRPWYDLDLDEGALDSAERPMAAPSASAAAEAATPNLPNPPNPIAGAPQHAGEPTAREWLGLSRAAAIAPEARRPAALEAPRRVAPTALARPLGHAAWVDGRLSGSPAAREPLAPAAPGYVWIAPPVKGAEAPREERTASPRAEARPPVANAERAAAPASPSLGAATAGRPSALPDLRLPVGLEPAPGPLATASSRLARFVGQLVGARTAAETAPLPLSSAPAEERAPEGAATRAPRAEYLRGPEPERAGAATAGVRPDRLAPGATAAPRTVASPTPVTTAPVAASPTPPPAAAAASQASATTAAATSPTPAAAAASSNPLVTARPIADVDSSMTVVSATSPETPAAATATTERPAAATQEAAAQGRAASTAIDGRESGPAERDRSASAPAALATSPAPFDRVAPAMSEGSRGTAALRPGAVALRAERLGSVVDARAAASWGEPATEPTLQRAVRLSYVVPGVDEPAREGADPRAARRARGAAATARFVDGLVGVDVARVTAPRPLTAPSPSGEGAMLPAGASGAASQLSRSTPPPAGSASSGLSSSSGSSLPSFLAAERRIAPERERLRAAGAAIPSPGSASSASDGTRASVARPEPVYVEAAEASETGRSERRVSRARAGETGLRPGGLGVRAEQLAGLVGVKAAGLSIEFVDPAGLPALAGAAASPERAWLQPPSGPEGESAGRSEAGAVPSRSLSTQPISADEWALVATFPSTATAVQVAAARRAARLVASGGTSARVGQAPAQPLVAVSAVGGIGNAGARRRSSSPIVDPERMGAAFAQAGERAGSALPAEEGAGERPVRAVPELARDLVAPTVAAPDRAALPGGRMPRGSFTWPRGARGELAARAELPPSVGERASEAGELAAQGAPAWRAPSRPMVSPVDAPMGSPMASRDGAPRSEESPASALAQARPLLEVIRGGRPAGEAGSAAESFRRAIEPQPLVSAAPTGEAAARMVEAVRQPPPATATGDDRVTLSDLTLISIASANQQVAAAEAGGRPAAAPEPSSSGSSSGGQEGGEKRGAGREDIEQLAREVFDELQRLAEIVRERSGDSWES